MHANEFDQEARKLHKPSDSLDALEKQHALILAFHFTLCERF